MIDIEILIIMAIFLGGFYFGYKIKEGLLNLKNYLDEIRKFE